MTKSKINDHYLQLSPSEAKKLALLSQGIHKQRDLGDGVMATLAAIQQLSYVQIDTISVVQRAHHHCLWSRVNNYHIDHLNQLQQQGLIFEYWSHAAAYLPMTDFRYSLPLKQAFASGKRHWFKPNPKLHKQVLARIKSEGPLQAKDFQQDNHSNTGWWDWKPAKQALEQLFMEGKLMVAKRNGFQKVYDLTERVLPAGVNNQPPSPEEFFQHLIKRYLGANGIGKAEQIAYLRKGLKANIKQQCDKLLEQGEIIQLKVADEHYYALPQVTEQLNKKLSRSKVKILSPFDNVLIQRKRTACVFDFNYQIECYVPAAKRQYGYFSLPLLWGHNFAGRADMKMDRKTGTLALRHLHIETDKTDAFINALKPSLVAFMGFNQASQLKVERVTNQKGKTLKLNSSALLAP